MAWVNGKTYFIVLNSSQGLALNLAGVSSIYNNRNVNVYTLDRSTDQQWVVDVPAGAGYAHLLCAGNTAYGLDYYYGSDNAGNCDIYQIAGNTQDSKINFRTVDGANNIYYIQSYRNDADNNLYLTAASLTAGADVRWQPLTSGSPLQTWKLIEVTSGGGGGTLPEEKMLLMPKNVNQNYEGYDSIPDIRAYGCTICCGVDVSAYYGYSQDNTVEYFYDHYWYPGTTENSGYSFESPCAIFHMYADYTNVTVLPLIKSEVAAGRPVVVKMVQTADPDATHWVVAYAYRNGCQTLEDVQVLNPWDKDKTDPQGLDQSLQAALAAHASVVTRARTTEKK